MLNIPSQLRSRSEPVRVGVVGAGLFGTNLIDQMERVDGLRTAVVADIETDKAVNTLRAAGVPGSEVRVVDDPEGANEAVEAGDRAVLADGLDCCRADVEVVVEATGIPEAGARHGYTAITEGKHVVMVTVEADTVVGPILAHLAENRGVTYSMAYGDQPSVICELYDWAETVGLDVVAAGKGNAYLEENAHGTPDDIWERLGFTEEFVENQELNPRMYNSFFDGTKVAVEMCAVADATGLEPDVPGMHLPPAEIPEIPEILRPERDGGILEKAGVVDTVSSLYRDGSEVEFDLDFGVFVVTTTPNERVQEYFAQYSGSGLYTAGDGEYQVFYRPYHLPGIETPVSVANAAIRNEPTGVADRHVAEVVGAAKRDLEPGDGIDGGGGYTVYGQVESADRAAREDHVPLELLDGAEVVEPVGTDEVVSYGDVRLDTDSFIYHLRRLQEETL
jgi:predicted homoserine dehydrogenase-like protein